MSLKFTLFTMASLSQQIVATCPKSTICGECFTTVTDCVFVKAISLCVPKAYVTVKEIVESAAGCPAIIDNSGDGLIIDNSGDGPIIDNSGDGPIIENSGDGPIIENSGDGPIIENSEDGSTNGSSGDSEIIDGSIDVVISCPDLKDCDSCANNGCVFVHTSSPYCVSVLQTQTSFMQSTTLAQCSTNAKPEAEVVPVEPEVVVEVVVEPPVFKPVETVQNEVTSEDVSQDETSKDDDTPSKKVSTSTNTPTTPPMLRGARPGSSTDSNTATGPPPLTLPTPSSSTLSPLESDQNENFPPVAETPSTAEESSSSSTAVIFILIGCAGLVVATAMAISRRNEKESNVEDLFADDYAKQQAASSTDVNMTYTTMSEDIEAAMTYAEDLEADKVVMSKKGKRVKKAKQNKNNFTAIEEGDEPRESQVESRLDFGSYSEEEADIVEEYAL